MRPIFIFLSPAWMANERTQKQMRKGRLPLGSARNLDLGERSELFVRLRESDGRLISDRAEAYLSVHEGNLFVASPVLTMAARSAQDRCLMIYFEGTKRFARCLARWWIEEDFYSLDKLGQGRLRLGTYNLPPRDTACVTDGAIHDALIRYTLEQDPDLFSIQAGRFLDGPHVLERLFDHLMELRASEAPNFITVTKGLADELRGLLSEDRSPIRICSVTHSHVEAWSAVQGQPVAFIDGGVARLPSYPGIEQFAMRVGTYRVVPGDAEPSTRERWKMTSCILGDVVDLDKSPGIPDRKRLQEAIRYCFEGLVLLRELDEGQDRAVFLHGPLINQFVTYDEETPHNLPPVTSEFVSRFGLTKDSVEAVVRGLPNYPKGEPRWDQFMAIYGVVSQRLIASPRPAIGVVERSVGFPVTLAILNVLVDRGIVPQKFHQKFLGLVKKFGIADDLLFGCVLKQGEYVTPVRVVKSPEHRAHSRWQPVVRRYGNPQSCLMKPHDATFPIRLELNDAAAQNSAGTLTLAYHTARLLPRYGFPVGLDIVDKYAKIPDWMTRAISQAAAGALLKRAVEEYEDPNRIAQIRRVLAGQPRDFFFRPHAN